MVDYSKTKIYRIPVGDKNYYGHTAQPLSKRARCHRGNFNSTPDRKLYKALRENNMTEQDIQLIWVEDYPCKTKEEAKARERYWIENFGDLNVRLPFKEGETLQSYRSDKKREYYYNKHEENKAKNREKYEKNKEQIKENRQQNKDKISETNKRYYYKNHEQQLERIRNYQEEHRAELNEKKREYRAEHKEELNAKRRAERWTCPHCNIEICRDGKARHMKRRHPENLN